MIDEHDVREMLHRRANAVPTTEVDAPKAARRGRRRLLANGALAVLATAGIALATFAGIEAVRTAPIPGDDPSQELGIFAPVAGRVVYGDELGIWAVDPAAPADPTTTVRLTSEAGEPLGWSRDGTELLIMRDRTDGDQFQLFPEQYLSILHADGSETPLNQDPMYFGGAAISPDGTRVVFAVQAVPADELGLYVVDAGGDRPTRLPIPRAEGIVVDPTFSPDGTRIAYVDSGESENHVWVMDADGGNAQEILADEPALAGGAGNLQWSPAGDRLAIQIRLSNGDNVISTFAPDGSDFTQIVTGGLSPFWSSDGSRIAYTMECDISDTLCGGLVIVDADGSNVRESGYAASGPWHPGASTTEEPATEETTPDETEDQGVLRTGVEVLSFTGTFDTPGDLVAVNPATGEERVLVEGLDDVTNARWSADGRWVAFESAGSLWVVGRTLEPGQFLDPGFSGEWSWSSTGARLAVFRGSTLYMIDPATGGETELASLVERREDVFTPVWSADGTKILFGVRGGTVYSVDVRTGERSLFAQLPGENLDSIDGIQWSPDGSRLVIFHNGEDLYVLNADGSDLRALTEDVNLHGFDWSPDGSRIVWSEDRGGEFRVMVAPADGSTPTLVASLPNAPSNPVWSPDGSQIALGHRNAFLSAGRPNLVIAADGSGEAVPLDDLTYESWRGGSYDCDCDLFG